MPSPRPPRSSALVLCLALVLPLTAAGCGPFGGGEELTREQFVAEGNAICERGREQYLELQEDPPQNSAEAAELTSRLIEITQGEIDDLRDLNAPAESEAALEDYLESREAGLEVLEQGLEAAEADDAEAYAEAQAQVARGQVDRARLAERAGLDECSQPFTTQDQAGQR